MGKAVNEGVHGAAKIAERTKNNALYFWHGIWRAEVSPASASHELCICCPGFGPVFCWYLVDSAVCSSEERAPSAYAAEVIWTGWNPRAAVEAFDGLDALDLVNLESRGLKDRNPNVV